MASITIEEPTEIREPGRVEIWGAIALALAFVAITRLPFARLVPMETDERMFVQHIGETWFPIHHTLFQAAGRLLSLATGDAYRGLVLLDMLVSGLALASVWWWLRALVRPSTALAATAVVAAAPVFWSLGEMAGNYTMIPLVGSFLLGVAVRGWREPRAWHPYASAVVLAVGTGYREDLGTFWLPVLGVILWKQRWRPAILALGLFTVLNLGWLLPMLSDVGGLAEYRRQSAEFAQSAGYRNSIWYLGFYDAPVRYSVKLGLAMAWTFGPGLLFLPRGLFRVGSTSEGRKLALLLALPIVPALGSHLLVHFGVAGYSFHYLPAAVALMAIGIGKATATDASSDMAPARLSTLAVGLACLFLFYPADFNRPGWRGDFDLAVARYTRVGLQSEIAERAPNAWRTRNSIQAARTSAPSIRAN
ncbi:hypothetical protein P12x_004819 [Tundrisphaera lichenicola]|uniref:hypothetical protein n=1 Tax=Tundrisphaera lichenicola TaxID=2029860 RepID=UPI003EB6E3C2